MGTLNFKFNEEEMQQLLQKYKDTNSNDLINYFNFVSNIDKVFDDGQDQFGIVNNVRSTGVRSLSLMELEIY